MAFPCFDEPSFKANFSVRIRRTSEHISLSNMPVVSVARRLLTARAQMRVLGKALPCFIWDFQAKTVELHRGLFEDRFHPSVKMSTYLVAFIICDFKSVTTTTSSGVQVFLTKFSHLRLTPLVHWRTCVNRCVSAGVHLRQCWEVAANHLRSGSGCQNDGFLWEILRYPLSSTKARYSLSACLSQ